MKIYKVGIYGENYSMRINAVDRQDARNKYCNNINRTFPTYPFRISKGDIYVEEFK